MGRGLSLLKEALAGLEVAFLAQHGDLLQHLV
jgi:hypothetical protein